MPSLRDDALARLSHAEQAELLRLGASARLADDDIVWVVLAAAVRLDLDRLTRLAGDQARIRANQAMNDLVERSANRITNLVRYAVQGARWERPAHRLALVSLTALVLLGTHLVVFLVAERAWIGHLSEEIAQLKVVREELRANSPPDWLTWTRNQANEPVAFVSKPPEKFDLRSCTLGGQSGTCIFAK